MISRDDALQLLKNQNPDEALLHHSLESEAVLRGVATKLNEDPNLWSITGLLHDVDFVVTKTDVNSHGILAESILKGKLPDEAIKAIKSHNYELNGSPPPSTSLDFALRCGESITGLVAANALVRPNGMKGMKPKSLKKKMKAKAFAANVNRDIIMECEKIGLELNEFLQIAIDSIEQIADRVGLDKNHVK